MSKLIHYLEKPCPQKYICAGIKYLINILTPEQM